MVVVEILMERGVRYWRAIDGAKHVFWLEWSELYIKKGSAVLDDGRCHTLRTSDPDPIRCSIPMKRDAVSLSFVSSSSHVFVSRLRNPVCHPQVMT